MILQTVVVIRVIRMTDEKYRKRKVVEKIVTVLVLQTVIVIRVVQLPDKIDGETQIVEQFLAELILPTVRVVQHSLSQAVIGLIFFGGGLPILCHQGALTRNSLTDVLRARLADVLGARLADVLGARLAVIMRVQLPDMLGDRLRDRLLVGPGQNLMRIVIQSLQVPMTLVGKDGVTMMVTVQGRVIQNLCQSLKSLKLRLILTSPNLKHNERR